MNTFKSNLNFLCIKRVSQSSSSGLTCICQFKFWIRFYFLQSVCLRFVVKCLHCTVVIHTQLQFPYEIYSRCRSSMSEKVTSISSLRQAKFALGYSLLWLQQILERLIAFWLRSGFKISSDFETLLIGPVRRLNMV